MEFPYVRNVNFPNRYISPQKLFDFLQERYASIITPIGTSVLGQPIYQLSIGTGAIKVAAWSQMHGNESTATLAMLDLLATMEAFPDLGEHLWKEISLDFILMLNPDGALVWERRNAVGIDVNRDFLKKSSQEMRILQEFIQKKPYDYALNLHDQRTIFTTDGNTPATLSFLAPSENEEREMTENRKKSMAVITMIYKGLEQEIPHHIGRYTDEFYPTAVGDNLIKLGIPTILFEGGYFPDDYHRQHTRQYYTQALYSALLAMAKLKGGTASYEAYFNIPMNQTTHYDLIYRNLSINTQEPCVVDIAVQYKEKYNGGEEIDFIPYIVEIGDCSAKKAWKEIDATGLFYIGKHYPKIDEIAEFEIGEI